MEILDGAFATVTSAPVTIALAAGLIVPLHALTTWMAADALGQGTSVDLYGDGSTTASGSDAAFGASVVSTLGTSLVATLLVAALAAVATSPGPVPAAGRLVRAMAASAPALVVVWVLVHIAEAVATLAFLLGAAAPTAWFFLAAPALVVERLGPLAALRRSARLVSRRFWPTVGFGLLVLLVAVLFDQAIGALSALISAFPATERFTWIPTLITGSASGMVLAPVIAAAATGWYLDLRVRTEGLDLALEADRLLAPS